MGKLRPVESRSMRSTLLAFLIFAYPAFALAQGGGKPFRLPGKTVALLVGTDTYNASGEWARLSSPVLDANTIAKTLAGEFGYDTAVVRNASKSDVIRQIVAHGRRAAGDDDWSLIFIAAHGYFDEERSQGYLVFKDSKPRNEDVGRSSYLSLTELRGIVEGFRGGHVLLVIDACYAGTIDPDIRFGTDRAARATQREMEESLLRRAQYKSRIYLTSGGKEYVPDGRPGVHSPFAGAFLGALRQASNDGAALTFNQIVGHMAAAAVQPLPRHNNFRGHEPGGDFLLVPRSFTGAAVAAVSHVANDPPVHETRGDDRRRAESLGTPPRATAPGAQALVLVHVDYIDPQSRGSEPGGVIESVRARIAQAFKDRGVEVAVLDPAKSLSAEDRTRCGTASGGCIDVTATVSRMISSGRHTVAVKLSARSRPTARALGSADERDGPRMLEVPADRMIERAVDKALVKFVDSVLGALGK
ncbi:MAG: caspase family protein [Gemmatimonadaceae bacterium]